jgi:hypothetical protein
MAFWQSRTTSHEHDRSAQFSTDTPRRIMRKAASMATLAWPRPASPPSNPVPMQQDRSPFPPRISSLNRVPLLPGWDAEYSPLASRTIGPKGDVEGRRPATAGVARSVEMAPGTGHAGERIGGRGNGLDGLASSGTSGSDAQGAFFLLSLFSCCECYSLFCLRCDVLHSVRLRDL